MGTITETVRWSSTSIPRSGEQLIRNFVHALWCTGSLLFGGHEKSGQIEPFAVDAVDRWIGDERSKPPESVVCRDAFKDRLWPTRD